MNNSQTTLMAYFQYNYLNKDRPDFQPLLYQQFPEHMAWTQQAKMWKPRVNKRFSIGRMYYCSPAAGERYFLRLLLTVVSGAALFEHLKTVDRRVCGTFREACMLLHLIEDDEEWGRAFEEAASFASGYSLLSMFISALIFNSLVSPADIWTRFCANFCGDLENTIVQKGFANMLSLNVDAEFYLGTGSLDYGLYLLQVSLSSQDRSLRQYDLPMPQFNWDGLINRIAGIQSNSLTLNEMSYSIDQEAHSYQQKYAQMNATQKHIFDQITMSISNNYNNSHFFLQGPAGTGKTFVYNALCHYYRSRGKVVLCVASSGIAALLLPGGRTSHSRFAIPLDINEQSVCCINKNSDLAELIRNTALIIWDEVPMQHRHCFEAIDRRLRDICSCDDNVYFGGIHIVLGGDFAQIAPFIRQGGRPETVVVSLISSGLWPKLHKLRLTENMRLANSNKVDGDFAHWVGQMSYDLSLISTVTLPSFLKQMTDLGQFIQDIYPKEVLQRPLPGTLPFILNRKQFPIKVSFAMTINKSQGQSVIKVGVDHRSPVFAHSQFYVAMFRATSTEGMTILLPNSKPQTQNVVYPEVLFRETT